MIKINIFFPFSNKPLGGGNQFLKALRDYFKKKGIYEENPKHADIILFNSHHEINHLIRLKKNFPNKIYIHRIDGPVSLIRNNDRHTDKLIFKINNIIADATIFQSEWSKNKNRKLGLKPNQFETIILNAPDPEIFNTKNRSKFNKNRKTKIIATSWSSNINKGFEIYKYLDENLNFDKYEMTFCGNSPFKFKNIKHVKPLPSNELAEQLKTHDIFITASQNDPCSNSLIEAQHCGLPAIALNDGGHPEIIGKAGLLFEKKEEIPGLIESMCMNYTFYLEKINLPDMNSVGEQYFNFMKQVLSIKKDRNKLSYTDKIKIRAAMLFYRISKQIK